MRYYEPPLLNGCFCSWITISFALGIWMHFLTLFCKSYSRCDPSSSCSPFYLCDFFCAAICARKQFSIPSDPRHTPLPVFHPALAKIISLLHIHSHLHMKEGNTSTKKKISERINNFSLFCISPVNQDSLHLFWRAEGCGKGSVWIYATQV